MIKAMGDNISKKDIDELLKAQTDILLEAMDERFQKIETHLDERFQGVETDIDELRQSIRDLTITLDNFLKRLTDHETEMVVFRKKLDKITEFIKEKFGVEITAQ